MSLDPTSPPTGPAPSPAPPAAKSRDRRRRAVRARSVNCRRISKSQLALDALRYPEQPGVDYLRPQTRAECIEGPRPCPYVSCRYHLYLDVHPRHGSIKLNFPDVEVEDMAESCALDVAERDGLSLEETAAALNMVRERIRQIEVRVLAQLRGAAPELEALQDGGRRRLPLLPPRRP
jgi:hypothetical protein